MHPRQGIPESMRRLMEVQAGVVTAGQCQLAGFSLRAAQRLVDQGFWFRAAKGIYVGSPPPWGPGTRNWTALLAAGESAALGLDSAARLWGWGREPDEPTVVVPHATRHTTTGPWSVHRTTTPFRAVGEPARTTAQRTCLDLCRRDPDAMVGHVTDAVNSRRTTAAHIRRELRAFERFPRRRFLLGLLDDTDEGALSVLEMMWLRNVERAHGLPRGERQTRSRAGLRDIRYGHLLVELDGHLGHTGRGAFRDMYRDNLHLLQGEHTLRFGFLDVDRRPCAAAAMVAAGLRILGEPIDPVTCVLGCVESEALRDLAA